jgi:hypothetical protein
MFAIACVALLCSTAAPVPAAKPPFEITLKVEPKKSPLDDGFASVEIRNHTETDLELRSTLPSGALVFLDTEVRDANDKRVSPEFYRASISSPFSPNPMPVGTIKAGKSLLTDVSLFQGIDEKKLVPGKYKCRVRFAYAADKIDVVSGSVTVDITAGHLKK